MSGDGSSSNRGHKNRPILADVTNQHGKRRFLSISSSPGLDRENRLRDNVLESEFVQKVCLGVENLVRGKCKRDFVDDGISKDLPLVKPMGLCSSLKSGSGRNSLNVDKVFGISGVPSEIKDVPTVLDGDMQYATVACRALENNDGLRDCCTSGVSVPKSPERCHKSESSASVIVEGGSQGDKEHVKAGVGGDTINSTQENELLDAHACVDGGKLINGGDLSSTKYTVAGSSSVEGSGLEICASSSIADDFNANHACSCSFCQKAAYIWSDLHYQDVKGRIAALKKSRKEVKFCVDGCLSQYGADKNGMKLTESKNLELDLMARWKSLFLHTENILVRESTQLQSNLLSLKELRGSCKTELEMTNGIHSKNYICPVHMFCSICCCMGFK
ncbi:hypothetical protein NE237_018374 [Protea cynaroides]|uniref:Uncharacterized protein n=1 Tax=Protea cynaroides TaxID=273540 RepID=A0A9Q0QNY2_9MAGN|nr:hypothetical protein NE237_018374 [Protea cynaroides]